MSPRVSSLRLRAQRLRARVRQVKLLLSLAGRPEQAAWAVTLVLTSISARSPAMFAYASRCFSSVSNMTTKSTDWNRNYMLI